MNEPHKIDKGYYFNYMLDAANLYWAARWLELHYATDPKEKMLDELMVRRLRSSANNLMLQVSQGFEHLLKNGVADEQKVAKFLEVK